MAVLEIIPSHFLHTSVYTQHILFISKMIDWKKIDEAINEAIEKDEPCILLKFFEIEEYRYIQKVVEVKASEIAIKLNESIFIFAVGISFLLGAITFAYSNINTSNINLSDLHIFDKYHFFNSSVIAAFLLMILAWKYEKKYKPQYNICNRIILTIERKILQMEIESRKAM